MNRRGNRVVWSLLLGAAACFAALGASGDTYGVRLGGDTFRALATPVDVQGVAYVPLGTLVRQWGGAVDLRPAWVQLELNGATVVGGLNDTQITAGDQRFGLVHPLLRRDDEVLIAVSDLPRLVESGFRAAMDRPGGAPGLPPVPPPRPVVDLQPAAPAPALEVEDAASLLAPMAPPAAPPPTADLTPSTPEPEPAPEPEPEPAPVPVATARPGGAVPKVVLIDPGHGGGDTGTVAASGLAEKDVALQVAKRLEAALRAKTPLEVRLTRDADRDLSLRERAALAGAIDGVLLVSLHGGAAHAPQANGIDVFHPGPPAEAAPRAARDRVEARADVSRESRHFAEAVAEGLRASSGAPLRGVREARLRIFQEAGVPAVLIELGHLTNPAEAALLAQDDHQQRLAEGIADGVAQALARLAGGDARR